MAAQAPPTTARRVKAVYRALILDVDGVIKMGGSIIPRVPEAIETLRARNIRFVLATNNSTKSPEKLSEELGRSGLRVHPEEIVNSAQVLVDFLKRRPRLASKAREGVYVVGEQGLIQELAGNGYPVTSKPTRGMVVVGLDREFDYQKLAAATQSLMMGAAYLASNMDRVYPTEQGLMPGAGSIAAAISAAANRKPTNVGKPSRQFFQAALARLGDHAEKTRVLVVGDKPETDIRMANAVGCHSALVLSGVTKSAHGLRGPSKPTYVFQDLYELVQKLFGAAK